MQNLIKYKKGKSSWVSWIQKRIKHNLNFLAIAEGQTGIGKSWALLSLAYQIDKEFEPRQVAFSFKAVMNIINSDWFMKKKWRIIIFDEAQTNISNRNWQSLTNKLMNYLLSTFRHRNIILFMSSPYSDFLDSQTMKLMHCKFEVRGHNKKTKKTRVRPKLLQYNSKMKKFYEHSLFVLKDGKCIKTPFLITKKPPQHLIDPYEQAKIEFTTELNKNIMEELNNLDKKNEKPKKPLTDLQQAILDCLEGGIVLQKDIAEALGKNQQQISINLKYMANKGYRTPNSPIQQKTT